MESNSVSPAVRWAIAQWPDDAVRGAVSAFCDEHRISRRVFYKIRAQARSVGAVAALEPASRAPVSSPGRVDADLVAIAVEVRRDLVAAGLDHGPLSVIDRMRRAGLRPPSRATLARYFQAAGRVVPEPRKRPRAAMRRFVYPAPNCMWQIDAFDWTLADGSAAVVFQVIDDHSRLALASLAARGETSHAAIEVVGTAMDRWGVPQRLLSDNGGAFNPTRRGHTGRLVEYLTARGTEAVTGRPGRRTTQGKNERIHQTMLRYLHARPPAETIGELQDQIETFDAYYNHERGHQSLPGPDGLLTPAEAWQGTAPAEPPQPPSGHETSQTLPAPPPRPRPARQPQGYLPPETRTTVAAAGRATAHGTEFHVGNQHATHTVIITFTSTTVLIVAARTGELLRRYARPAPGTRYAGPRTHPDPETETETD